MANQRGTFTKRRREQELQDRARAKNERRAARRNEPRSARGPQIAWDEAVVPGAGDGAAAPEDPAAAEDRPAEDDGGDDAPAE